MISISRPRRRWLISLAIAALVPLAASGESISWQTNYELARQQALRSGRPVLVSVSSKNCSWCRKLERTTFRDPRVVGVLNGQSVPLKIDANDPAHEALVAALGLQGVPTLAVIMPDGRIVANQSGYLDAPEFLSWLRPVVGE